MPLPKISYPTFDVFVKSLNRSVKFRPFLVKEEKLLLIAKESENFEDIFGMLKQIATNCCLEELDIDSLPSFDIEMIFVNLRINSIGERAELSYTCNNVVEKVNEETAEKETDQCGYVNVFGLDLKNIKYEVPENHSNVVQLTDKVGVVMRYPNLTISKEILKSADDGNDLDAISLYVDYVFDENQKYERSSFTTEELNQFLESLSLTQLQKIRLFFETTPRVVLKQTIPCVKCGYNHNVEVEGVLNFFD